MHCSFIFVDELALGGTAGRDLTLVEDGVSADGVCEAVRDELNYRVDEEDGEGNSDGDGPLFPGQGNDLENETGPCDDADLENEDEAPDEQEDTVVEETFEDVPLVVNLPSTDHVHDLHQCEQVEEEGKVL